MTEKLKGLDAQSVIEWLEKMVEEQEIEILKLTHALKKKERVMQRKNYVIAKLRKKLK